MTDKKKEQNIANCFIILYVINVSPILHTLGDGSHFFSALHCHLNKKLSLVPTVCEAKFSDMSYAQKPLCYIFPLNHHLMMFTNC